jgi:hypothetical protein
MRIAVARSSTDHNVAIAPALPATSKAVSGISVLLDLEDIPSPMRLRMN